MYLAALIIHIFCAIIFLGYVFSDVLLSPMVRKTLGGEIAEKVEAAISSRATKIMPVCVLLLVLSGGFMMSKYINSSAGYFDTPLQMLLWGKVALVALLVCLVIFSLSCYYIFKVKNPLGAHIHKIVLVIGVGIVLLAKVMFFV